MSSVRTSALKLFDATLGATACRVAGWLNYQAGREIRLDPIDPERVRRILIIRPGGMGDMILLLPTLRALRDAFPHASLDLVCERRNGEIAAMAECVGRIMTYDATPVALLTRLVRQDYDIAVDTEQFHHFSALFGWLSGAPVRIGFSINPVRNPLYTHLVDYLSNDFESEQFAALLQPLGISVVPPVAGYLRDKIPDELPARAQLLRDAIANKRPVLIAHAGSSVPYKQWGEAKTAELVSRMVRNHRCVVVFVGAHSEQTLVQRILSRSQLAPSDALSMVDGLPLETTATLIKSGHVFLGGDSGLAHLAVAMGTPTVRIFGPSDERKWGAQGDKHRAVTSDVPCRPCCLFGYHKPCHTIACLQHISVDQVETALSEVLASQQGTGPGDTKET